MSPQWSFGYGEISTDYKAECLEDSPWGKWESKREIYAFHLVVILIVCNFTPLESLEDKNIKYVLPVGSLSEHFPLNNPITRKSQMWMYSTTLTVHFKGSPTPLSAPIPTPRAGTPPSLQSLGIINCLLWPSVSENSFWNQRQKSPVYWWVPVCKLLLQTAACSGIYECIQSD